MTIAADQLRTRRQHFAAPGGFHDLLVKALGVALPAGVGALFAYLLLAPLTPRGEVSFLLDRNQVEVSPLRVKAVQAMYRGDDARGRPFSIKAGEAMQRSSRVPEIEMKDLAARIALSGGPALLTADSALYDFRAEEVAVRGAVVFQTSDGYRLATRDVDIDLNDQSLASQGSVEGQLPAGSFSADRIVADLDAREVMLDGRARLRMVPGAMKSIGR